MTMRRHFERPPLASRRSHFTRLVIGLSCLFWLVTGCSSFISVQSAPAPSEATTTRIPNFSDRMEPSGLQTRETPVRAFSEPYPFTTPLPPSNPTSLDGLYAKIGNYPGTPVPCRRCPDYLAYEGAWTLWLERGVYRVHFLVTGWRSVGSFTLTRDQITFFNDPNCPNDIGTYEAQLHQGSLILQVIQDTCMFGLRSANFSASPWRSCVPPNLEAAVTDHWLKPPGC